MRLRMTLFTIGLGLLAASAGVAAEEPRGTEVKLDKLVSLTPASWKPVKTDRPFRFMEFSLPKVAGDPRDAELVIFHFGEGGGGGIEDNIRRWKNMFEPPEGKKIDDVFKQSEMKIAGHKAVFVELNGTYLYKASPMDAQAEPRPEHRMVAVIFQCPKGPYFIRLVGPEKTVAEHRKAFDEWLKNFK